MKNLIRIVLASLLVVSSAGSASATHDGGTHYNLLLVGSFGGVLVAECDLQGEAPVRLRLLDWRGRIQASYALPSDSTAQLCEGLPASADEVLSAVTDPAFRAAVKAHGATLVPVAGADAPSGKVTLKTSLNKAGTRLSMVLRNKHYVRRRGRIRAKAGFGPISIDVQIAWHPESRFVYVVGSKVARVSAPMQLMKPVFTPWRVGRLTAKRPLRKP